MQNVIDSIIDTLCELNIEQIEEAKCKIAVEELFSIQQKTLFITICDLFIICKQMGVSE